MKQVLNSDQGFSMREREKYKGITESKVHRNSNPRDKYRICCELNLSTFHEARPPKTAASCRFLSIEPSVASTGDKRDEVSI